MIIGNYTADDSVGEAAPSPISPEPSCRKGTIRGGRVLDGGDACHVSAGKSPAGVGTSARTAPCARSAQSRHRLQASPTRFLTPLAQSLLGARAREFGGSRSEK